MTNNYEKISFDDAYKKLVKKFPEQKNKILINSKRFKNCLRVLRMYYQYEPDNCKFNSSILNLPIMNSFNVFFDIDKDFITKFGYEHICKRINKFDQILKDAEKLHNECPIYSKLTPITSVCPKIIQSKRHKDKDNRLELTELIKKMDYLYIQIPPEIKMIQYNYCWLLGSYYSKKRITKYGITERDFQEDYPYNFEWGYEDAISMEGITDNSKLCRINSECFQMTDNGISVNKIFINDEKDISIDCINGGILTTLELIPDFYYHIEEKLVINFENLFVVKEDAQNRLNFISKGILDSYENQTVNTKRVMIIKYAIEYNLLDNDLELNGLNGIPVYKYTKKQLFEKLANCNKISTKFKNENKTLFNVDPNEFFKSTPDIKSIIKFKSGRPKINSLKLGGKCIVKSPIFP